MSLVMTDPPAITHWPPACSCKHLPASLPVFTDNQHTAASYLQVIMLTGLAAPLVTCIAAKHAQASCRWFRNMQLCIRVLGGSQRAAVLSCTSCRWLKHMQARSRWMRRRLPHSRQCSPPEGCAGGAHPSSARPWAVTRHRTCRPWSLRHGSGEEDTKRVLRCPSQRQACLLCSRDVPR